MFLVSVSRNVTQCCMACTRCEPKVSRPQQYNNFRLNLVTNWSCFLQSNPVPVYTAGTVPLSQVEATLFEFL
jgi:hypothetical protein